MYASAVVQAVSTLDPAQYSTGLVVAGVIAFACGVLVADRA